MLRRLTLRFARSGHLATTTTTSNYQTEAGNIIYGVHQWNISSSLAAGRRLHGNKSNCSRRSQQSAVVPACNMAWLHPYSALPHQL